MNRGNAMRPRATARRLWGCLAVTACVLLPASAAQASYGVLGQPNLKSKTLATRCPGTNAHFNFLDNGGFQMYGPVAIAISGDNRMFVSDYGGQRIMSWPDTTALTKCQSADKIIGAGDFAGVEAMTVDSAGRLYVTDTLAHAVYIYAPTKAGGYRLRTTLGTPGTAGGPPSMSQFDYPRGIAIGDGGRLFLADDYNNRILIFDPPFTDGESAVDSISAGADGGFSNPKALAFSGKALFVADYYGNRVLRFTGPFNTPDQVYAASASFTGLNHPVDLAVGPDGSLYVTDQGNQRIAIYRRAASSPSKTAPDATLTNHVEPDPLGIGLDSQGRLFLSEYEQYRVLIKNP